MKRYGPLVARILLGLMFFVFGLNGFLNFIHQPPPPPAAMSFLGGLIGSGYFFPFLKATETICGALLLGGFFVPLVLVILAPVVLNILAFHLFLEPSGLPLPIVIIALQLYLAWAYRAAFRPLLVAKAPVTES